MNPFGREQILAAGPDDVTTSSGPTEQPNVAGATGRSRRGRRAAWLTPWVAVGVFGLAGLLTGQASRGQEPILDSAGGSPWADAPASDPGRFDFLAGLSPPPLFPFASFYIDYRIRRFSDAHVTYEFGVSDPRGPNPISRLQFPISSTWNGLEVGLESPSWAVHAEWLTPWSDRIDGRLEDRDWLLVGPEASHLGIADERWIDGQVVDVAFEFLLAESRGGLPISVWPVGGFRWQKFELMAFDGKQLQEYDLWFFGPIHLPGDVLHFRQEYYHYYGGGQLRIDFPDGGLLPGWRLTFQGDGAYVDGCNLDHHLLREGVRITKQNTHGGAWHVGVTAEVFLSEMLTVGVEGEHTVIRTAGNHHWINEPLGIDEMWSRGVHATSEQTSITVFLRLRR